MGALDENLGAAIERALLANRRDCMAESVRYDWDSCTDQFLAGLYVRGQVSAAVESAADREACAA